MRLKFFTIPVFDSQQPEAELNQFCAAHRVLSMDKELVQDKHKSFWTVVVNYVDAQAPLPAGKERKQNSIDYREVLNEADFASYVRLRNLRNEMARQEGVPPYALFTNGQLAQMVQQNIQTRQGLLALNGVGPSRVEKYAEAFLAVIKPSPDTQPQADEPRNEAS